ncbi:MAG TPA: BatD family protein [Saprospiraceae bacterium]|nr:BatD family protein [Saprospiraceae bacterium]
MKIRQFIALGLLFWSILSFGQNEMLEVQVSKDSVYFGNQVKVTFIASNISGKFIPPAFDGFDIINGPFTSSSYSFVNGESSRKTTYTYLLQPKRIGEIIIGKAGFNSEGKELFTNEIPIYVRDNPNGIREDAEKQDMKQKSKSPFDNFGKFDDFFFNMPDFDGFDIVPKEKTPPPPKKTYKFKTETL